MQKAPIDLKIIWYTLVLLWSSEYEVRVAQIRRCAISDNAEVRRCGEDIYPLFLFFVFFLSISWVCVTPHYLREKEELLFVFRVMFLRLLDTFVTKLTGALLYGTIKFH